MTDLRILIFRYLTKYKQCLSGLPAVGVIICTMICNVCIVERLYEQKLIFVLEAPRYQKSARKTTIIAKRDQYIISH